MGSDPSEFLQLDEFFSNNKYTSEGTLLEVQPLTEIYACFRESKENIIQDKIQIECRNA